MLPFFGSRPGGRKLYYNLDLPSFQRDFASLKTLDHGTGPAITFTRASNATYYDANGVLQTAANDVPRFDHDPATGASRGLLIEEARTNLFERSAEFDNAYWNKTRATITANDQVSPDGGTNAEKLTANATNASGSHVNKSVTITSGATVAVSAFFKKGSDDHALVFVGDAGANGARQWFNLTTGAVASSNTAGSGWAKSSASISSVGGGWYRCVFVVTTTGTTALAVFYPAVNADLGFEATDAVTFGYIWGAQLEQGAFPTSHIPTTTAAATRSADSAVVTPISSFYNQAEGTLFAEWSSFKPTTAGGSQIAFEFGDGTTNNRVRLSRLEVTGFPSFQVTSGGSDVAVLTSSVALAVGTAGRVIGTYKVDDFSAYSSGSLIATDSAGAVLSSATTATIGRASFTATGNANGHIRKIAYWPKRLTNTLLEQLTT